MSVYERWAFVLLILGVHAKIDEVLWCRVAGSRLRRATGRTTRCCAQAADGNSG